MMLTIRRLTKRFGRFLTLVANLTKSVLLATIVLGLGLASLILVSPLIPLVVISAGVLALSKLYRTSHARIPMHGNGGFPPGKEPLIYVSPDDKIFIRGQLAKSDKDVVAALLEWGRQVRKDHERNRELAPRFIPNASQEVH